jgi:hypothetical protein
LKSGSGEASEGQEALSTAGLETGATIFLRRTVRNEGSHCGLAVLSTAGLETGATIFLRRTVRNEGSHCGLAVLPGNLPVTKPTP